MTIKAISLAEAVERINDSEATLEVLRGYAAELDLNISGNIGLTTLRKKLVEAIEAVHAEPVSEVDVVETEDTSFLANDDQPDEEIVLAKPIQLKDKLTIEDMLEMNPHRIKDEDLRRKVMKLQYNALERITVTSLDPADAGLPGNIWSHFNKYLGAKKKFIPYGEATANGYHVPRVLAQMLRDAKYVRRTEVPAKPGAIKSYKNEEVPKFAITTLPPLTRKELDALASRQGASGAIT